MKLLLKIILTIQFFSYFFIFAQLQVIQAANVEFKPQVRMGEYQKGQSYLVEKSTAMIAKYIRAIYKYAIGIVGILATVVMMLGGIMWLTAGGNQTRIGEAKAWITASISGLVIALCSYLILATVNPALVNFNVSPVEEVINKPEGDAIYCCAFDKALGVGDDGGWGYRNCSKKYSTKEDCIKGEGGGIINFGVDFQPNKQCSIINTATNEYACTLPDIIRGCCLYDKILDGVNAGNYKSKLDSTTETICKGLPNNSKFCGSNTICKKWENFFGSYYYCE